jgi:hypothetical protein
VEFSLTSKKTSLSSAPLACSKKAAAPLFPFSLLLKCNTNFIFWEEGLFFYCSLYDLLQRFLCLRFAVAFTFSLQPFSPLPASFSIGILFDADRLVILLCLTFY